MIWEAEKIRNRAFYRFDFPLAGQEVDRQQVINAVCEEFGCTKEQLVDNTTKTRRLTDSKRVIAYILRKRYSDTVQRIAMVLNRDRTSINKLLTSTDDLLSVRDPIAEKIARIEKQLFKQP